MRLPSGARRREPQRLRVALALLAPFAALFLEWWLWSSLRPHVWLPLSAAVFIAALLGGLWAGISATLIAAIGAWRLFIPDPAFAQTLEILPLTVFIGMGIALSLLQAQLRRGEQRFFDLFEHGADGVFVADLEGRYTDVNRAACALLGYTRDEILRMNIRDLIPPSDFAKLDAAAGELAQGDVRVGEWKLRRKDGSFVDVEINAKVLPGQRLQAFVRDITERRRAEAQLTLAASVFEGTTEGLMVTDAGNRVIAVNEAFTAITGFSPEDVLGRDRAFQQSDRHDAAFYEQITRALEQTGRWQGEIWKLRKDGTCYPAWEQISVVRDPDGGPSRYVSAIADITPVKEAAMQLIAVANQDTLTELPNRRRFTAVLERAIDRARRHEGRVAVMFLDLDRFKRINDTMGHASGDVVLKEVARRLRQVVRETDSVARLAGDEFVIAFESVERVEDLVRLANKLMAALARPVTVDGCALVVSASLGIALFPEDGAIAADLIRAADAAMYRAKQRGRRRYEFYAPDMRASALDHLALEGDLRHAISRREFSLHYQPQVDLGTGRVVAAEALLRWQHPRRGLILPDRFIPLAEESSLIADIGAWAVREAISQARAWRDAGLRPPRIAVNVSRRQLLYDSLPETIEAARRDFSTADGDAAIELEITESVLDSLDRSTAALHRLRSLGVGIAIDDFGTGYSSLSLLPHLPLDALKIDRVFVGRIPGDAGSNAIAVTIISMAHTLGLRVIAEGIEDESQLVFLRDNGCDEGQGYLFGAAMTAPALAERLEHVAM